jgi:CRISPR/Cas system-associated exonuclease Cas4 (RecB family)
MAVIDWKTGKKFGDAGRRQAEENALILFAMHPHVDVIKTMWVYLNQNETEKHIITPPDVAEVKERIVEVGEEIKYAEQSGFFQKKKGALCRFCPVIDCENNRAQ